MKSKRIIPRGIRNNNPLNIKLGDNWKGLRPTQTDTVFCQFISMKYGYRAAFIILKRYINVYGLRTIKDIIYRWCPDNTADAYVSRVCKMTAYSPYQLVVFEDEKMMWQLVSAMTVVECGCKVNQTDIILGYYMANVSVSK